MSQRRSKIIGLLIFLITIFGLSFTALSPNNKKDEVKIKSVSITGNQLLPASSYLHFARLNGTSISSEITLHIIKTRLEKHPYITSADVSLNSKGEVEAELQEKSLAAILMIDNQTFLLSNDLQLLPLFDDTKFLDLPIINNPNKYKQVNALEYVQSNEIIDAVNIITILKECSSEMIELLSEVNLNNGDDIFLTFSGVLPVVKLGRNNIPQKILALNEIWAEMKNQSSELSKASYVDLRFGNQIYFKNDVEIKKEL